MAFLNFIYKEFLFLSEYNFLIHVLIRAFLAVIIGAAIGSERARHGRAAGMRTHILVCLGAALTSMTGIFAQNYLGNNGDILRLAAQVISGVGFLGAGMIILKNNNIITGLTTAAGVWTTSVIGIAIGCGFYSGAIIVATLYLITIILLGRFEKKKKLNELIYIEINDMYKTNEIIEKIEKDNNIKLIFHTTPPKSGFSGNIGINFTVDSNKEFNIKKLIDMDNVVYAELE